jgi:hypothetical protein
VAVHPCTAINPTEKAAGLILRCLPCHRRAGGNDMIILNLDLNR